jgi:hypothetical protein
LILTAKKGEQVNRSNTQASSGGPRNNQSRPAPQNIAPKAPELKNNAFAGLKNLKL